MHQMMSKAQPDNNRTSQVQTMIITAITLFALSGLMVGFVVGAFARPPKSTANDPLTKSTPIIQKTATPTATPPVQIGQLGCPYIDEQVGVHIADGTTKYTLKASAHDKTGVPAKKACDPKTELPVVADGITCKLWMIKSADPTTIDDDTLLKDMTKLQGPFPHEITNGLIFDPATPQTHLCDKGVGTWNYSVAPNVDKGTYLLMVLTDWNGQFYNWSWGQVTVKEK